jgi:hypothetical protein
MQQFQLEITTRGYLILPGEIAGKYYPEDACVALIREEELWVLPIMSSASGGLMMKQRNLQGDRSVLVWEALPDDHKSGNFPARWDSQNGAMRIDFQNPI